PQAANFAFSPLFAVSELAAHPPGIASPDAVFYIASRGKPCEPIFMNHHDRPWFLDAVAQSQVLFDTEILACRVRGNDGAGNKQGLNLTLHAAPAHAEGFNGDWLSTRWP
ncbi:MAG: hypothetical protein ACREVZ_05530, partial [Burkholderiales bacterium]